MISQRKFSQLAAVVLALACLAASPAFSANAVRILVNDQPITTYDIQQRGKMLRVFSGGKAGEKEAVDQLIDEQLMLQEAARLHIDVGDDEVSQEIADRARAAKMTSAQFSQAMRQAGFDPATFRQFMHANMVWSKIVRARFRATVNVTDQDVAAALGGNAAAGEQKTANEYMLQQILFLVPKGSGASVEADRLNKANAFHDAFQGCDHSVEQARGSPGIVVKPTMRREETGLPNSLKSALAAMNAGDVTKPERVPEGFQIVGVCAKNAIAGQTEAAVAARDEISGERGQLLARRYLRDLRSDAVIEYR